MLDANKVYLQILTYVCVGGVVVALNVSLLYAFTEFLHIYYLASAAGAFCIAFLASFFLQKFFTFRDASTDRVRSQMTLYLALQLANISANMALLYALVEYLKVWYILAEVVVSLVLAAATFIFSRRFIFVRETSSPT
jgi:putative flippase GtrA